MLASLCSLLGLPRQPLRSARDCCGATKPGLATEDTKAWRPIAAFESKSGCFLDASTKAEALARVLRLSDGTDKERKIEVQRLGLGGDHLAVKSTFSGGLFDGARMWTFYRCLPDTVNPRGPKGTK